MEKMSEIIKERVLMRDLLEFYGIHPIRGDNNYLCMFHDDHKPSAGITKDGKYFHCFPCGKSWSVIDVVMALNNCDYENATRIIDTDFGLGVYRWLTEEEKLELDRASRERKRRDLEREHFERYEKQILNSIASKMRKEEQVQEICKQMKGKCPFAVRYEVYIDSEKRLAWLNWLYESICEFKNRELCEWDYTIGGNKMELLKAIEKGELSL